MMKKTIILLLVGLALPVQAAPFAIQPQAGQWQITTQTKAEGQDIGPKLQLIKQQAAAFLNAKQMAKLNQYDPSQFTECLTPAQSAVLSNPEQSLAMINKALGQCELQIDSQTTSSMAFSGYCTASKQGMEGQITGQLTYQSATHATGIIEGVGTIPSAAQLLLIGRIQPTVHLQNQFTARWQQSQCQRQ